jgi:hypothetical protein
MVDLTENSILYGIARALDVLKNKEMRLKLG